MATIQVREIPEESYEVLRQRAHVSGQSLQAYMRDQVVALASKPTKAEAVAVIEAALAEFGGVALTSASLVADVHADRR